MTITKPQKIRCCTNKTMRRSLPMRLYCSTHCGVVCTQQINISDSVEAKCNGAKTIKFPNKLSKFTLNLMPKPIIRLIAKVSNYMLKDSVTTDDHVA